MVTSEDVYRFDVWWLKNKNGEDPGPSLNISWYNILCTYFCYTLITTPWWDVLIEHVINFSFYDPQEEPKTISWIYLDLRVS